jgi:hypothetical protein
MALLDKLTTQGSTYSNLDGADGKIPNFKGSKLHNEYSLTGNPFVKFKPKPSTLDLNGLVPKNNYRATAPEGRTF